METIVIDWKQTNLPNLPKMKETHFYTFSRAKSLIYVGITKKTSSQTVEEEINNSIKRLKLSTTSLIIWLGYMNTDTNHSGLRKNINDSLILDSECLLIFKNQPIENEMCKQSYTGRKNLRVINRNFSLLYPTIWADENGNCHFSND